MIEHEVVQPGSAEPAAVAPRAAVTPEQQAQDAPRRRVAPRAGGFAAAFGSGSGAAWVFRDLASI